MFRASCKRPSVCEEDEERIYGKRRKTETLMSAITNNDFDQVKKLVNEGIIDVSTVGDFVLNDQKTFYGVPPLFAAILTGNETVVDYLVGKYPHFRVEKIASKSDRLILPTDGVHIEEQLDVVEAIGVTCLLRGNHGTRTFGWTCLQSAMLLRLSQLVPFKISHPTSHLEKQIFGTVRQVKTMEELNDLKCKTSLREVEALSLHTLKRILMKYNRFFSNDFAIESIHAFSQRNFSSRPKGQHPSRIFSLSLYLVQMFQSYILTVTSYSKAMIKVIMSTLIGLKKVLGYRKWVQIELSKENNLITLKNTKIFIDFLVVFTEKITRIQQQRPQSTAQQYLHFLSEKHHFVFQELTNALKEVLNAISAYQEKKFLEAINSGSVDLLSLFIAKYGRPLAIKISKSLLPNGQTPVLLAIELNHLDIAKFLVNDLHAPLGQTGRFSWKNDVHHHVPPIVAAVISSRLEIVDFLVEEELENHILTGQSFAFNAILNSPVSRIEKIERFELLGATFILHGNHLVYWKHLGTPCWEKALFLRSSSIGRPQLLKLTDSLEIDGFFGDHQEFRTDQDLNDLTRQVFSGNFLHTEIENLKIQACLVNFRILKGYSSAANLSSIHHLHDYATVYFSRLTTTVQFKAAINSVSILLNLVVKWKQMDPEIEKDNFYSINLASLISNFLSRIQRKGPEELTKLNLTPLYILRVIDVIFNCRLHRVANFVDEDLFENVLKDLVSTLIDEVFQLTQQDDQHDSILEALLRLDGVAPVNSTGKTLRDLFLWKRNQLLNQNRPYAFLEKILRNPLSLSDLALKCIFVNKILIVDNELPQSLLWMAKRH